jgi:hypothetical protein
MADRYTSQLAAVLDRPLPDVEALVRAAGLAGDIDRGAPVRGDGKHAMEVHWGGRMQRAVVRAVEDERGHHLLRVEAYVGDQGPKEGLKRQAALLQGLLRHLDGPEPTAIRDVDALRDHDVAWVHRTAVAGLERAEAVDVKIDGEGVRWLHTHGAARFDLPDLELYGLAAGMVDAATAAIRHVHDQLFGGGLATDLVLATGEPVYLVPVLEAWQHVNLDWPGVGRQGKERGVGLDGPRATLSLLHRPRLGRYRTDIDGVLKVLRG